MKDSFDEWIAGRLVIEISEVYEAGNWTLANKLKPLITEPMVSVRGLYKGQRMVRNHARFVMFSNHEAPLSFEDGERRYFIHNSKAVRQGDDYYVRFADECLSGGGVEDIYAWLMRRDISGWKPLAPPPETASRAAAIEASVNPLFAYVAEHAASGRLATMLTNGRGPFSFADMQDALAKSPMATNARNKSELTGALEAAGFTRARETIEGSRKWLWSWPYQNVRQAEDDTDF